MTKKKKGKRRKPQRNPRLEMLQRSYQAGEARRAMFQEPFGRLFSELDRWVRLHCYRQITGLSKAETALIFLARDVAKLTADVGDIAQSMIRIEAMREAELQRSYGLGIGHV